MIGIASAVGAAASLASSIYGAVKSSQANRKAENLIQAQRDENKRWYNQQMAEDYTQRSDSQAILKKQREMLDEQYKRARATNVVAGGTDESLALQQQAANKSLSDTATNIASQASIHKDNVEQQYRQTNAALNQQQVAMYQQQAASTSQAAGQGVSAGLGIIGSLLNKKNA